MKKLFTFLVAVLILWAAGCSKAGDVDDTPIEPEPPQPPVETLSVSFGETDTTQGDLDITCAPNKTQSVRYRITSSSADVRVEVTPSTDITAIVVPDKETLLSGSIEITTGPTIDENSNVVVVVSNPSKVITKRLVIENQGLKVYDNTLKTIPQAGGTINLEFMTNVKCEVIIPEDVQTWINEQNKDTRALEKQSIVLNITKNTELERSAEVVVKSTESEHQITFHIVQAEDGNFIIRQQRMALEEFYKANDGDNWFNTMSWCTDAPLKNWVGVKTDAAGMVTELAPSTMSTSLDISMLDKLTHLETLYLDGHFRCEIPKEIGNLKSLKRLGIGSGSLYGDIPAEIGNLVNLEELFLSRNQLKSLPAEIGNLVNLEVLELFGTEIKVLPPEIGKLKNLKKLHMSYCKLTSIPDEICELESLENLYLEWNGLTGKIPTNIGNLKNLTFLGLNNNALTGEIPPSICELSNIKYLYLNVNELEGTLPENFGVLLDHVNRFNIGHNNLSGKIPASVYNHPKWVDLWPIFIEGNNFDHTDLTFSAPEFNLLGTNGQNIVSKDIYAKNTYTILYRWEANNPYSDAYTPLLITLYNAYKSKGVEVIGYSKDTYDVVKQTADDMNMPWTNCSDKEYLYCPFLYIVPQIDVVDSQGKNVFNTVTNQNSQLPVFIGEKLGPVDLDDPTHYTSTDYSADGQIKTLQTHTSGNGIKILLTGDHFVDKDIADGTFDSWMNRTMEGIFELEPMKSFRSYFDVYSIATVSKNRENSPYAESALNTYIGWDVETNDAKVLEYANKVFSPSDIDNATIVVIMNIHEDAGVTNMYYNNSGLSIAYIPLSNQNELYSRFEGLLRHEVVGHAIGKLGDEYVTSNYKGVALPAVEIAKIRDAESRGWFTNIDLESDPSKVKWSKFISDPRYAKNHPVINVYEGAMGYGLGVYRSSPGNSLMNHASSYDWFNAPAREAIYKNIHKLAYGSVWTYDYEEFVKYDAINEINPFIPKSMLTRSQSVDNTNNSIKHNSPIIVKESWQGVMNGK